jgi:heme/copper-type cytochrome/quinol oxidase subunit 2
VNAILNSVEEPFVVLPFPSFWFGVIAIGVFVLLGLVTWSYRDVANRHEHKVDDSKAHH